MRLPLSYNFSFGTVRAAFACLLGVRWSRSIRALAMPLLVVALCGYKPVPPQLSPTYPSGTATIGLPYSSAYACTARFRNIGNVTCVARGLPPGLGVQNTPGCIPSSRVSLAAGASLTCAIAGTPTAAGTFNVGYLARGTGVTRGATSRPFIVAKRKPDMVSLTGPSAVVAAGTNVGFFAKVTVSSGPAPTGTVGLYDATNSKTVQRGTLANGSVTFSLPAPSTKGTTSFSAVYEGDSNYLGFFSLPINLVVN